MKKLTTYFIFVFILLVLFTSGVNAETKKYEVVIDDETTYSIKIDKNNYVVYEDVVQYDLNSKVYFSIADKWFGDGVQVYMYTTTDDYVYQNKDLWWSTIYYCYVVDGGFGTGGADEYAAVFPDSLSSFITGEDSDKFLGLFGTLQECHTMTVKNVDEENQVAYCGLYEKLRQEIIEYKNSYVSTQNISYKNKYREVKDELKAACNLAMAAADWNDPCVNRCSYLNKEISEWDAIFDPKSSTNNCGFSDKLIAWILNIMKWVKYIVPVFVIILGIIDFIKAIGADKEDEMKKAQGKFIRRLIAAALIFLVPLIIEFILDKFGFSSDCGLF